jgi:hypothetical protein
MKEQAVGYVLNHVSHLLHLQYPYILEHRAEYKRGGNVLVFSAKAGKRSKQNNLYVAKTTTHE